VRAWTVGEQKAWEAAGRELRAHLRVKVKDGGGTWRDLTTYAGADLVVQASLQDSVDDDGAGLSVELSRGVEALSLAPLHTGSPLNLAFGAAAYAPLLQVGREVQLEAGVAGDAQDAAPLVWNLLFHGYLDEVSWPGERVRLECTDLSAKLRDTFIEVERVYGYTGAVFAGLRPYEVRTWAVGEYVLPPEGQRTGFAYYVTVGGASSSEVLAWPTTIGLTVVSGGATFRCEVAISDTAGVALQTVLFSLLQDHAISGGLTTPVSPGWQVLPYLQQRESLQDAIQALVAQLGWTCRYRWDGGSAFVLTLKAPDRTRTLPDLQVPVDRQLDLRPRLMGADIRNVVRVVYSDVNDVDAEGTRRRKAVEVADSASITKYGRRFCEVSEDSTGNLGTNTQATTLAQAILDDLKEPTAEVQMMLPFTPWVELGDLVELEPNGLHWDGFQSLGVMAVEHSLGPEATTTLTLRGKPTAGLKRWLALELRVAEGHQLSFSNTLGSADYVLEAVPGGLKIEIPATKAGKRLDSSFYEIHAAQTPGFTPGPGTLILAGATSGASIVELPPNQLWYTKHRPYAFNAGRKVLGLPSVEKSIVTGRAKSGHLDPGSLPSHLPLNGNFEHQTRDVGLFPPDHWDLDASGSSESWGPAGSVEVLTDTAKGRYIRLRANGSTRGTLKSSPFPVRRGIRYLNLYLSIRRNVGSGFGSPYDLLLDVYQYSDAALTTLVVQHTLTLDGSASGPYPSLGTWYDTVLDYGGGFGPLGSGVNFLVLRLRRATLGSTLVSWDVGDVYVQEADFFRARLDQPAWSAPTFNTGWGNVGGVNQVAGYLLDSMGFVRLRGNVRRTSGVDPLIFTLPVGLRPAAYEFFVVQAGSAYGDVEVQPTGQVRFGAGAPAGYVSLAGIAFDTR
jgi:hypothetical protein